MKKKIISTIVILSMILIPLFTIANDGPSDPGGDPSGGGDPIGGGAPIGGGLVILLSLGAAYGGKKLYDLKKESLEE